MQALTKIFFDLCFLKAGPQDVPASHTLLNSCVVFNLVVSSIGVASFYDLQIAVLQVALVIGLLAVYTKILLYVSAKPGRFLQTFTALNGTSALIGVIITPILLLISVSEGSMQYRSLLGIVYFVLYIWQLVIYGNIFRHALSKAMFLSMVIVILYVILTNMLVFYFFPPPDLSV